MNTSFSRRGLAAASILAACLGATAHAVPVTLISGAADPYDMGYLPAGSTPPQPFDAASLASLSDGNSGTGFSFTSHIGEYSGGPTATSGFQLNFDFDVSQYETIDGLDFSWTGRYELGAGPVFDQVSQLWLSAGDGRQVRVFVNGNDLGTDLMHTYSASWERVSDPFTDDVDMLLHDGLASVYLQTEIGIALGNPDLAYLTLDSREVALNVRGTLKGPGTAVPTPGPLPLIVASLGLLALTSRLRANPR